jgi:hypothetical protein
MDLIDDERLKDLRFGDRRGDFEDGFIGKERRPFGDGDHLAAEPIAAKPVEKTLREEPQAAQIRNVRLGGAQGLDLGDKLVDPQAMSKLRVLGTLRTNRPNVAGSAMACAK